MKMEQKIVEKYLNNNCTLEESKRVLEWFDTKEGKEYLEASIQNDLERTEGNSEFLLEPPIQSEEILHSIYRIENEYTNIGRDLVEQNLKTTTKKKQYALLRYAVAASVSLVFIFSFMYYWFTPNMVTYATAFGETREILLPDESKVTLNGNSSIVFKEDGWDAEEARCVLITGEAYFSVKHTKNHQPFTVHTEKDFSIRVLGTEFNVTARENRARIALNSGSIELEIKEEDTQNVLKMVPGEVVEFEKDPSFLVKKQTNTELYSSWKDHKMSFENTSIKEITRLLKDNYGMSVVITDTALLQQTVSGSIPSNDVDILLEGLSHLLKVEIVREDNLIKFNKVDN